MRSESRKSAIFESAWKAYEGSARKVRALSQTLPRIAVLILGRKCAYKDCRRSAVRLAISGKAAGIQVQEQWFCGPDCFENFLAETFTALNLPAPKQEPVRRNRVPLGLTLLARGHLSRQQLDLALDRHRATGLRLGDIILHLGFASEEQVTSALAEQWGHPVFPLRAAAADTPVSIPVRLLELNHMLPVHYAEAGRRLLIGFAEGVDYRILDAVAQVLPCAASPCIIAASEYRRRLENVVRQNRGNEVGFDGECSAREMAHIIRNYAVQVHAQQMRFATCRDHLWARLNGGRHEMDILFRLAQA